MAKKTIFSLIIFFILLEVGSIILTRGTNKFQAPNYIYNSSPKSLDINPLFGVWHFPNSKYIQKNRCIDVVYKFNSYGARDSERSKNGSDRSMVLGDSFIEGYGIDTSQRLTNQLEKITGNEFLNLGTSGGFGSTQMYLSYKYFRDQFEHDRVIVGLFPTNDFSDDSYDFGMVNFQKKYRPYHLPIENSDSFRLIYHVEKLEESSWSADNYDKGLNSKPVLFLNAFTHFGTVLRQAGLNIKQKRKAELLLTIYEQYNIPEDKITFNKKRIAHNDFIAEEYDILLYNLKQIKSLASQRPVYVFTIAAKYELHNFYQHPENNKLGPRLKKDLDSLGIHYIDIIGAMKEAYHPVEYKNLYLECDGHWSAEGNQFAAKEIKKHI